MSKNFKKSRFIDITNQYGDIDRNIELKKVKIDNNLYYFKPSQKDNFSFYSEMVFSEISKMVGMASISPVPAKAGIIKGTLSKDFEEDVRGLGYKNLIWDADDNYWSHIPFSKQVAVNFLIEKLNKKIKKGIIKEKDSNKILNSILKTMLLDIFLLNNDRHPDNIRFIEEGGTIKISPLFDNDRAFLGNTKIKDIKKIFENDNPKKDIKEIISKSKIYFIINDSDFSKVTNIETLRDIRQMSPKLFNKTTEILSNINFENIFLEISRKHDIILPKIFKKWVLETYSANLEYLNINKEKKDEKKY